ncbi:syntaxin-like protein [Lichtheimia corymbifera JMRC:FSU:9682]|uniref:Syntaxin-like protein n=1 Tax=Lichtheimia corymbifera JMRC:FSU:9682 TaxID=1263082 RepID=A0A068S3Z0_9FUNG|nr:syntaxin-like protein [Lichtheimia corymbifera JMRC:FSU:9682]
MSYSFRDRTEELRNSFEGLERSDDFGPARIPAGYRRTPSPVVTRFDRANSPPPPTPRHHGNTTTTTTHVETYEMQTRPMADTRTMDGFLQEIEHIKTNITIANDNIDAIERLHNSALVSYSDNQWNQLSNELEQLQTKVRAQNNDIKTRITALERNAVATNASEANIRKTQSEAVRKRFLETIRRYQDIENGYRQKFRQRVERQIRIVKPEATEEEIDHIMESDQNTQLFTQSILKAGRQAQSRAVLSEVQSRHDDIKRIEKTLLELHDLFQDMQMLVTQQGEVIVQIEQNAEATAQDLKHGNRNLSRAIDIARSTRAKKWCCFVICIILAVVIAILVWWFAFDHPGVGGNNNNNNNN